MNRCAFALAVGLAVALAAGVAGARDTSRAPMAAQMGSMGAHMSVGPHMTMTRLRAMTPADRADALEFLQQMRIALSKYQDYKAAETDGYEPFMPTVPQDIYHFANRKVTAAEYRGYFNVAHPGSLLYEKKALGGYRLVGAMYDAPPGATLAELNRRIPLGVGRWHAHTNICLPQGLTEQDVMKGKIRPRLTAENSFGDDQRGDGGYAVSEMVRMRMGYLADPRFGFNGTIFTRAGCEAVEGNFYPQIFGWMIHVYPFGTGDNLKAAFSTTAP